MWSSKRTSNSPDAVRPELVERQGLKPTSFFTSPSTSAGRTGELGVSHKNIIALGAAICVLALSACGFALRGSYELPYRTIFVTSARTSVVAGQIRRELTDNLNTKMVSAAKDAEVTLTILDERRDRNILSLSGSGRVREYDLRMKVQYQFVDNKGMTIIPTSEILLSRTYAYDDTLVIAKQQEETMLYQDMERDATGQILRRMIAIKRPTAAPLPVTAPTPTSAPKPSE